MLFNSIEFIFFFVPLTLIFYSIFCRVNYKVAAWWLVFASFVFYSWWNASYVYLLLSSILMNHLIGNAILRTNRNLDKSLSKIVLYIGCILNIFLLIYYKYFVFILNNVGLVLGKKFHMDAIELPLGISFFTFTQIAFLVDTYKDTHGKYSLGNYFLFVTYFPHLIAGPILHHAEMMPQFQNPRSYHLDAPRLATGLTMFSLGLFKKAVFADKMGTLATPFFDAVAKGYVPGIIESWLGALAYTLQLYYDFSGYSDMAVGISFVFGFTIPINFDSPYKASSVIDFWRRWHITLSRFLRVYVYIPLGGNRNGSLRRYTNLMLTMLIGGAWHGAGWTFILWGAVHGFYLVVNTLWKNFTANNIGIQKNNLISVFLGRGLTFICVVVAWVIFRSDKIQDSFVIIRAMFTTDGTSGAVYNAAFLHSIILVSLLILISQIAPNTQQIISHARIGLNDTRGGEKKFCWPNIHIAMDSASAVATSIVFTACVLVIIMSERASEFLYFQF
jgi:alginate O-acetyltransferase complex protein AlgI